MGKVIFKEHHFLEKSKSKTYTFNAYSDFKVKFHGTFGPKGLSPRCSDLLEIGLAIYHFEKIQSRYQLRNPITKVEMDIWLRVPGVWQKKNLELLTNCLNLMGNTEWIIRVHKNERNDVYQISQSELLIDRVVLFSGGVDSTAGLATIPTGEIKKTMLCSYYSKQKAAQKEIAMSLGFIPENHFQFWYSMNKKKLNGKNRSYFYRSILFLLLAAVVAESYDCHEVIQFENGVLATSVPPSPSILITKHAHPDLHIDLSVLLSNIFGATFKIINPFLPFTKRQCVQQGYKRVGQKALDKVLLKTESCWFKYSNFIYGGVEKKPNKECGVCIPCIMRRTAVPNAKFVFNLNSKIYRNDFRLGQGFRSYYAFTEKIWNIRNSANVETELFKLMPAAGRAFITKREKYKIINPKFSIEELFQKFASEFRVTFK